LINGHEVAILDAGIALLTNVPGFEDNTAWPNVTPEGPFPTQGALVWRRVHFNPNKGRDFTWGNTAIEARGHFRIEVCGTKDEGQAAIDAAQLIIDAIEKGTPMGPVRVNRRPWMAPLITMDSEVIVPVTIPYSGIITD
jgi:hypothetical protein